MTIKPPAPVHVQNTDPIPVEVEQSAGQVAAGLRREDARDAANVLMSAGQRRVNIVWEITQATVAISVTFTTLYVSAALATQGDDRAAAFLLLSNAFFLVIGFYFGRTNHQRIGGVGRDDAGR